MLPARRTVFRDAARGVPRGDIALLLKTVRALIANLETPAVEARRVSRRGSGGRSGRD
jgi:hypothetical protein